MFDLTRLKQAQSEAQSRAAELESIIESISVDVLEQRRASELLRTSEERTRLAMEATGIGLFDWNLQTGRVWWSDTMRALLGWGPEGEPDIDAFLAVVHTEDRRAVSEAIGRALNIDGPGELGIEHRVIDSNNRALWMRSRGKVLFDGRLPARRAHRMLLTVLDVTDEHETAQSQRFLAEAVTVLSSSLDYRATLDRVAQLAVESLADWCVVDLASGDRLERLAIAARDPQKIALARRWAERHPPDPRSSLGTAEVIRTGKPEVTLDVRDEDLVRAIRDPEQLRLLRKLGLCSSIIVPMIARDHTLGAIVIASAESRRRYGAKEVNLALELGRRAATAIDNARLYSQAQQALEMREDLLAIVSHDLRNPLGVVTTSARFLLSTLGADDTARQFVELIRRAAGRMELMIGDLLDMASIHAGRLTVKPSELSATSLLKEVEEAQRTLADEKGVRLQMDVALDEGTRITADPDRLFQVFGNLVGNAIKFCTPDDTVTIRARRRGPALEFRIADTGPGIAAEELQSVFEPYWSGAREHKKGLGLGLYIAKGIVEAHGSSLDVTSEVGSGTTFTFCVTIADTDPDAPAAS